MVHAQKHRPRSRRARLGWVAMWAMLLAGCPPDGEPTGTADDATERLAGVTIRLAIVDDVDLAKAIRQRMGDWQAQTGSTIEIVETDEAAVLSGEFREADAVIYPAYLLGPLAEKDVIRPVSPAKLAEAALNWQDVLSTLRLREVMWGRQVYALPLGSPVLQCYCRADMLSRSARQPPSTWRQYQELVELFSEGDRRPQEGSAPNPRLYATAEPLAPGWAGLTLLARAAAYAKHPDHYSTLFSIDTMEPLIGAPPFVRALEELAAAARWGPPNARELTPDGVRRLFHEGHCALAITWPSAAGAAVDETQATAAVTVVELPGAQEAFNPRTEKWSETAGAEVRHVPLLGVAGRLGSATAQAKNAAAAERLLAWLIGSQWGWGTDIAAASPATTMFRGVHVAETASWIEPLGDDGAMAAAALTIRQSLEQPYSLRALPLAGRGRYVAALDEAVYQVLDGRMKPEQALLAAAQRWRAINKELGIESQRRAYRRSLGLAE